MEKNKRKHHKEQASQLDHDTVRIQDEAREQKRKNTQLDQKALSKRDRKKRDKTAECIKQANVQEAQLCNSACVRNDGEQYAINGAMEQKTKRNMGIAKNSVDFPLPHDIAVPVQPQQKKKKMMMKRQKRTDLGVRVSFCDNHAKDEMHASDEDGMLFNFGTQPKAAIVDDREPQATSDRREEKAETFLETSEILQHKKQKKRRDEKLQNSFSSNHYKESILNTDKNDMVFNFVTQPSVANTVVYKTPVAAADKSAVGSFQKGKNEISIEQNGLKELEKKEMTAVDMRTAGKPEENRNLRKPSRPTFSMAVAGSIVDNAQSLELATMLAGQIARAATIFRVDEIVVFDDYDGCNYQATMQEDSCEEFGGLFMERILKYLEVPQYLRKSLIPMHRSLSSVGKLPPLDAPHHLRRHEWQLFREGVVLNKRPLAGSGSCVDVGLEKEVVVSQKLKPGMRVTVAMGNTKPHGNALQVVDRETAQQAGFYWGYSVRYARCLSAVFDECPYEGKYDFCIGTSEHGEKLSPTDLVLPKCKHLLVAFGGLGGLEESVEIDRRLQNQNMKSLFDRYINTCPNQGSRTIRTEEAVLISLQFLQAALQQAFSAP